MNFFQIKRHVEWTRYAMVFLTALLSFQIANTQDVIENQSDKFYDKAQAWYKAKMYDSLISIQPMTPYSYVAKGRNSDIELPLFLGKKALELNQVFGEANYYKYNYTAAKKFLRSVRKEILRSDTITVNHPWISQLIGHCYSFRKQLDSARFYMNEAFDYYHLLDQDLPVLANIFLLAGNINIFQGKSVQALDSLHEGMKVYEQQCLEEDELYLNVLNSLILGYNNIQDGAKALKSSEQLIIAARNMESTSDGDMVSYLINHGIALHNEKRFNESIQATAHALAICERIKKYSSMAKCHTNLGAVYADSYKTDLSFYHTRRAIEIRKLHGLYYNNPNIITSYYNLGVAFANNGNNDLGYKYLDTALQLLDLLKGFDVGKPKADLYVALAKLNYQDKDFENGFILCKKANKLIVNYVPKGHYLRAQFHGLFASYYLESNQLDSAKFYIDKIKSVIPYDESATFNKQLYFGGSMTSHYLDYRQDYFYRSYEQNNDIENLLEAYNYSSKGEEWIDFIKSYYPHDYFLGNINKNTLAIYENGVKISLILFDKTEDIKYYERAINLIERSKSSTINERLNLDYFEDIGMLSDTIISKEKNLNDVLNELEAKHMALSSQSKVSQIELDSLGDRLLELRQDKIEFYDNLKKSQPNYLQLKHQYSSYKIEDLREKLLLSEDRHLITYLVGYDYIFVLQISDSELNHWKTPLPNNFADLIDSFQYYLEHPDLLDQFVTINRTVYKLLFENLEKEIPENSQIIICPAQQIGLLNFETLLNPETKIYLISKYEFYPNYSINSCVTAMDRNLNVSKSAAFKPTYLNTNSLDSISQLLLDTFVLKVFRGEYPLNHQGEIDELKSRMSNSSFIGEDANRSSFVKSLGNTDLIHLSAHSYYSKSNPLFSSIIFNNNKPDPEENLLRLKDIYNLKINSKLIMLSSCNTAKGPTRKGEGVINWSHAFEHAGVSFTGMALWSIPEKVTSDILSNFYSSLNKKDFVGQLLRNAKIHFIETTKIEEYRHPFYWGGMIIYGPPSSLDLSLKMEYSWIRYLLVLTLAVLAIFLFRKIV